jgi:hypothetical protein
MVPTFRTHLDDKRTRLLLVFLVVQGEDVVDRSL